MLKTGYNILEFNILYILAHAAIQSYIYIGFILTNTFSKKKSKIEYASSDRVSEHTLNAIREC